jgi:membrane-associated phospholipid phosphatase
MSVPTNANKPANYFASLASFVWLSLAQLVRSPSHSRRAEAARHWARRSLLLTAILVICIVLLMIVLDAREIALMPARGTAWLWPVRILTDFGKSNYVLWVLFGVLLLIAVVSPRLRSVPRSLLISLGTRFQFLFLAVAVPVLVSEIIKGIAGRGRPFVGGVANPYNFTYFAWHEPFASFPSGHATTSFALAFAVSAVWPGARAAMIVYALIIAATRLVLLAHHPSDVVAGALLGVLGAMAVRYWFAARHLAFTIHPDGTIDPLPGPSWAHLKRVARGALAP